jgi:Tfp pilus assembly protein PilE
MKFVRRPSQGGFTLIEILVIAPIVILAIGAFLTVIISMTGEVLASRGANTLTYNIQDAMNRIEQDVKLSSAFLAQNDIALNATEQQGYNNDATNFTNHAAGTSGTTLILKMVATHGNPLDTGSSIVYLDNQPNACASADVANNVPLTMNVVYFVKNNTLWRRTIMPSAIPSSPVTCSTVWQQASCAQGYTPGNLCKTNDVKLVEGVSASGFSLQYFTSASGTTPNSAASTGSTVSDRNTALSSTPTVAVSISASQSVAGRTIERSATLRAIRLETTATSVASSIITAPSTPIVTGKIVSGENATFTWPISSGGSVTYDVDYNINGGAWTNALNDTTNLTYSRIALRDQTVNVRVSATNAAGTSSYGTASVKIPLWSTVPLQNSWTNYDAPTHATFGYTKTTAGLVVLKGLIKRTGSPVGNEVIFTLPEGFRPPTLTMYQVISGGGPGRLYVATNGEVSVIGGVSAAWLSLQDLSFISSTAGYSATTLSTVAPWVNYVSPPAYDLATSITDTAGRVNILGMLKSGSTASEVNMVAFASGTTPDKRVYLPTPSGTGTYSHIVADTSGFMKTGATSASYTGINSKFYPGSRPSGTDCTISWCTLSLSASWVPYGAVGSVYAQPQYTLGPDGLVMLRGLIKNGTVTGGTTLTTLPSGYRPKEHLIFQVNANGATGRLDVFPTGVITIQQASATFTSMDNMFFMID